MELASYTAPAPTILRQLLDFWKICTTLVQGNIQEMARNVTEKLVGTLQSTGFHQKLFQLVTLHEWCHEKKYKPWNYLSLILNLL